MDAQSSLGIFGEEAAERRREAIGRLEGEARALTKQWQDRFGLHDTPVPIDRGYHNLAIALRNVGEDDADDRIAAAIDHLAQAKWILEQEDESNE
jgi:hypothetical protein